MTTYQALDGKGRCLYQGDSLGDIRRQIIRDCEGDHIVEPDIMSIIGEHDNVDFELSKADVKAFCDDLHNYCDFKFWQDEDTTKDWRVV